MTNCDHSTFAGMRYLSSEGEEVRFRCPDCDEVLVFPRCRSHTRKGTRCLKAAYLVNDWCGSHQEVQFDADYVPPSPRGPRSPAARARKTARILELRAEGRTVREIMKMTVSGPNTVSRVLRGETL